MDSLVINRENIPDAMGWIATNLARENLKENEIYVAQMLVEELFLRFSQREDHPDDFSARLSLKKRFSDVSLVFVVEGEECNPLVPWSEDNDEDVLGYALLSAHRKKMRYARKWSGRENVVYIHPHESIGSEVRNIILGLIVGALAGTLMYVFVSHENNMWIASVLIDAVQTVFINALMMAVAPMIFFSVIAGIISMSDSASLGRIGWHLVVWSLAKLAFYVAAGLMVGYCIGGMKEMLSTIMAGGAAPETAGLSIRALLTGIVPGNFITPFAGNNIMQTLFLACLSGVILNRMEGDLNWAREGVDFLSRFTMEIVGVMSRLLPFMVGISTAKMILHVGPWGLIAYGRLLLGTTLGLPLCFIISAALIALAARLSPLPFLKRAIPFSLLPFSTSSSNACMPATLSFCTEKLGIHERLSKFAIPVGMQFNMDGTAYYVSVVSMMLACTFDVTIDADFLLSLFFVEFLMALTGVGLLVMPSVLESMGIPGTAIIHFIGIEPLMDMPGTAQSVVGNITSTLLVAASEKQMDIDIYNRSS
ncbi:Na+/H+-dicarboxylate symporter [Selenomonas ruminantium]|uniref:Na+/H+-dicarboxylate symporter n=1 Tax=Selenomonas ruminantium TaxID=971 RepID=A0A1M6RH87_SELRU|nr:cation:dicarboxylase symporter family transporter [Selenomonas ruminantium]SHK31871.1 Na+/H+-dicarboxylate symporter [Selenomonas ruminantium]